MAGLNPAERIQLVLDWHYDMVVEGKRVAKIFDTGLAVAFYQQLHYKGRPLSHGQVAAADKIIRQWHNPS
jgi:hypothetical protein